MPGPILIVPRAWRRCWDRGKKFAIADMVRLQNNELSIPARSLTPLFHDLAIGDPVVKAAAEKLLHWDHVLDKDLSKPASMKCSSAI